MYLWLQQRLLRSQRNVIVVAIDDEDFWRGAPAGESPLNRAYLADIVSKVAAADPSVIGIDVGLECDDAKPLSAASIGFLQTIKTASQTCPVVLPMTIRECGNALCRAHDIFDDTTFGQNVTSGHTSGARDVRQIPTRVILQDWGIRDSFALALFRSVSREVPLALDNPHHPWPYSFFLPATAFAPREFRSTARGLLTARAVLAASPEALRQWLRHHIVLIGGVWHATPHGGALVDEHLTPSGPLPGVITQANYVQSLLWDAMYAMPRPWHIAIEIFLSLVISVVFLAANGWRRHILVLGCLVAVVFFTWVFSAAIGIFFDMVVPIAFLGLHAAWEEGTENFQLELRKRVRYGDQVRAAIGVAIAIVVCVIFVRHEIRERGNRLTVEQRLQVVQMDVPARLRAVPAASLPQTEEAIVASKDQPPPAFEKDENPLRVAPKAAPPAVAAAKDDGREQAPSRLPQFKHALRDIVTPAPKSPQQVANEREDVPRLTTEDSARQAMESELERIADFEHEKQAAMSRLEASDQMMVDAKRRGASQESFEQSTRDALSMQVEALSAGADRTESYKAGVRALQEAVDAAKKDGANYAEGQKLAARAEMHFMRAIIESDSVSRAAKPIRREHVAAAAPSSAKASSAKASAGTAFEQYYDLYPTQRRMPVLRAGAPLETLLPLFDADAGARMVDGCVSMAIQSYGFDDHERLTKVAAQRADILANALLDDLALKVTVTVAPSSVEADTVAFFAPHRIAQVMAIFSSAGVKDNQISADPNPSPTRVPDAYNVNLNLTLCRTSK